MTHGLYQPQHGQQDQDSESAHVLGTAEATAQILGLKFWGSNSGPLT